MKFDIFGPTRQYHLWESLVRKSLNGHGPKFQPIILCRGIINGSMQY